MQKMTITEALAFLKTNEKKLDKKRESVSTFLYRSNGLKDPLEKDGGSEEFIKKELQAIADLERNHIKVRTAIQAVNLSVNLTINGTTMSIAEWLTWKKEVAYRQISAISDMRKKIQAARNEAARLGRVVVGGEKEATTPTDLIVNLSEKSLAEEAERLEDTLGTLDGQLSLKNATVMVEVAE